MSRIPVPMHADAIITLVVLTAALVLLVTERIPPGLTGLLTIAALAAARVLTPEQAFAGLRNPAVITVGSMYVLSAAVTRTGAAGMVVNQFLGLRSEARPLRAYYGILLTIALLSGFVNNTPLVLIFLPLVLGLAKRLGEAPSKLLIPLSFVSILGGMCTLIGTSTNLIVASSLAEVSGGSLELGLFSFAPLGVVLALSCGLFLLVMRRRLLPVRPSLELLTSRGVAVEYMTELEVRADSPLVGRRLEQVQEEGLLGDGLTVLEVVRREVIRVPGPEISLQAGDYLLLKGAPDAVLALRMAEEEREGEATAVRGVALTLFEVVVTPGSRWIGRQVSSLGLRDRYGVSVFALQRHGDHLREQIGRQRLLGGDVLLVQGVDDSLGKLRASGDVLVVEGVEELARDRRRAPRALLALAAFVVAAVSGLVPVEVAALGAALLAVLGGCLPSRAAYEAVHWDVLFLLAGTLALGKAFESTGLAESSARAAMAAFAPLGLYGVVAAVLVFTMLLTQVLSNNATAALMTPLAYELGTAFEGASPLALVMAVAFGANCSFLTPVAYNTNLIVYGPGGYRFQDFLRPGLPVTALFLVLATLLLPVLY